MVHSWSYKYKINLQKFHAVQWWIAAEACDNKEISRLMNIIEIKSQAHSNSNLTCIHSLQ